MVRSVMVLTLALIFSAPALANEIEVLPGAWTYEYSALIGVLPMQDAGTDCVGPAETRRSLSETAAALGAGCAISSSEPIAGGFAFTLACQGAMAGEVKGQVVSDGSRAVLSATGWAGSGSQRVPVQLNGSAERLGATCS